METDGIFTLQDSEITIQALSHQIPTLNWDKLNVLILPSDDENNAFYAGTLELLDYFSANFDSGLADIFILDENYKELTLHSKEFRIGTLLVISVIVPFFVNLLSGYIYDKLKADANDNISITVIVQKKNGSSKSIQYTGKVEKMKQALDAIEEQAE